MSGRGWLLALALPLLGACQSLNRFDTQGSQAYCGYIVNGQFIRTDPTEGGFGHSIGLTVQIDTSLLTTTPATITSDDTSLDDRNATSCITNLPDGGIAIQRTFDHAKLRVTPEVVSDPLSTMTFEDGQVQNIVGWVDSTCRGRMLAIISLYKNDNVEVRFLRSASASPPLSAAEHDRDAFALFALKRSDSCPF